MSRKILSLLIVMIFVFVIISCSAHRHIIGNGSQTGEEISSRQWYVLWGIVPLGDVDTKAIAGDATDYEIVTKQSVVDFIIGMFTGIVTVGCRTVVVKK